MMQSYAALNTIALAINQGIEKKDIFVLDKAYKLNGKYKDFSEIDLNTLAINSVYAIGKPVSMEPNQDLVEIKYLFESLHKVNKILYRFAKKRITKEDRLEAYNVLKQKGFLFVLNFIIDKAKNKVEDEERLNVIKNVENECSKVLKKYQEYLADKEHFDDIEAKLEKSNDEELTESEKRVEKNYYKKFYEHIFVLPRPVVGIYYKKENKNRYLKYQQEHKNKKTEEIITDVNELSARSSEVEVRKESKKIQEVIINLKKIIREKNLTSLSAPQIGEYVRVFVINFNGDLRSFVNPVITDVKNMELSRETCSSIPDKTYIRPRYSTVEVIYQTPLGKTESRKLIGLAAKVFQHEIDHLDGLLLSDIGLEIDEDFDKASEEERVELINAYLDSLDIKQKNMEEQIKEDPELSQINDAIVFMGETNSGETKIKEEIIVKQEEKSEEDE